MKNPNFPAGVKPAISATITQEDGKTIELTDKNFMAGSVSFKSGTSDSNTFTVGGAIIGAMSFSLLNRDGTASAIEYENATVEATLSYGGQSVDMGKFWFVNHDGGGDVVKCDAYDGLQLFDEHQLYEDNITYPTTIQALANKIVTGRGFTLVGLTGADIAIDNPNNDDMTERECLSRLAQMMGMYVVARGMTIVFGRYDEATAYDAGTSFSHQLRTKPITITDIIVNVQNSNTEQPETFATGGGYVITIDDNPFITDDNKAQVQAMLDQHIKGLSFHPGTYSIKANPAIDVGDCINIQTRDAKYKAYVTNSTYKPTLQQSISADADNYVGDRRVSKKPKLEKAISDIAKQATDIKIEQDLQNPDSNLSQGISNGIHNDLNNPDSELSQAITRPNGSKREAFKNSLNTQVSDYIYSDGTRARNNIKYEKHVVSEDGVHKITQSSGHPQTQLIRFYVNDFLRDVVSKGDVFILTGIATFDIPVNPSVITYGNIALKLTVEEVTYDEVTKSYVADCLCEILSYIGSSKIVDSNGEKTWYTTNFSTTYENDVLDMIRYKCKFFHDNKYYEYYDKQ